MAEHKWNEQQKNFLVHLAQKYERTEKESPMIYVLATHFNDLCEVLVDWRFEVFCGRSEKTYFATTLRLIVNLFEKKGLEKIFGDNQKSMEVYELFRKAKNICDKNDGTENKKQTKQFEECDKQLEQIGLNNVLACFVEFLRKAYDPEDAEWKEYQFITMFKK